jgi:hypothetical protein
MSYKLHYAELNLQDDISCFEFESKHKLIDYVSSIYNNIYLMYLDKVCLVAISDHLIVVNSLGCILKFINDELNYIDFDENVYLQEYDSYEEAYKVALSMKEDNPLCYSKD